MTNIEEKIREILKDRYLMVDSLTIEEDAKNDAKEILALIAQRDKQLLERVEGMKKEVEMNGCEVCSYCKNDEVCIDRKLTNSFNQAIDDIAKLIK